MCREEEEEPEIASNSSILVARKKTIKKEHEDKKQLLNGWQTVVRKYEKPDVKISTWQIVNSFGGLILCWVMMYFSLSFGYWLPFLVTVLPAGGFLMRIFIIQHDCGHGAFFKSTKMNYLVGCCCSLVTLTPYRFWRKSHAIHHQHNAKLEERGIGDVWTMTVDEYHKSSSRKQLLYRMFRHPLFLFGVAPLLNFVVVQRIPQHEKWDKREVASVHWTNLALLSSFIGFGSLLGFARVICIQLPTVTATATAGTWLFYLQHQFEHTYWKHDHDKDWDYSLAAMQGSSHYDLPRVLHWFSGNIGFHHIHHLSSRIPNYRLEACHNENVMFQCAVRLTIRESLATAWLTLWDEDKHCLVTFEAAEKN